MKSYFNRYLITIALFLVVSLLGAASLPMEYQKVLKRMTLEEKVGQMLLLGIPGTNFNATAKEVVADLKAGGLVLFAANLTSIDQAREFTSALQATAMKTKWQIPLLITADEEGGVVSRMPYGMVTTPGNMALGATGDKDLVKKAYYHAGRQLRALGINMNLAPSLDVNNNPQNPVIGVRSFGSDPYWVSEFGIAALDGLEAANVGSIVKHFPGHGDTGTDSHYSLPIVNKSRAEIDKTELYPFKKALENGAKAVMTAHIEFPALTEGKKIPATLSSEILTDVLREDWNFNGVVSTDDLVMKAITNNFGFREAVVMAVKSGVDQVLIAGDINNQRVAKQAIIDAVKKGEISEERINQSVERILALKAQLGLKKGQVPKLLDAKKEAADAYKVALEVGLNSITMIKDDGRLLKSGDKVLLAVVDNNLMGAGGRNGTKVSALLKSELQSKGYKVDMVALSSKPTVSERDAVLRAAKDCDVVVLLTRNANTAQGQLALSLTGKPLITVAQQNPYDILRYPETKVHLLTYGYTEASIRALAAILAGEKVPVGKLPVTVSKTYTFGYKK